MAFIPAKQPDAEKPAASPPPRKAKPDEATYAPAGGKATYRDQEEHDDVAQRS